MKGSVTKRGDSWRVFVDAGTDPVTGRRRRMTGSARTKREAYEIRNRFLAELATGAAMPASGTVTALASHYFANSGPGSLASRRAYESSWRLYLHPLVGHLKLKSLTAATLLKAWNAMRDAGYSPGTIDKAHTVISAMCTHGQRIGWLAHNPARGANPGPSAADEVDPVSPEVLARALEITDGTLVGLFLRLAAATGARRGELCGLQWGDIDDNGRMLIRRRVTKVGEVLPATKTGRPRAPYLPESVVQAVRAQQRAAEQLASEIDVKFYNDFFIFSEYPGGHSWWPDSAGRAVRTVAERHGLEGLRPHAIRHFAVTQMLGQGVDLRTVAEVVGASPTTLLRTYAHYIPSRGKAAAEVLDSVLWGS